jgi:putative phosphoesterase
MKIGLLSDVHGNIFGLQKCYHFLRSQKCDKIVFLGDAIHYFGKSHEVLQFLKQKEIICIYGNHEQRILNNEQIPKQVQQVYNTEHVKKTVTKEDLAFMKTWKDHITYNEDGLRILLVHGSPWDFTNEYIYPTESITRFADVPYDIICMGHTHIPFIKEVSQQTLINVGSAGYRRDKGNRISCVTIDTKTKSINLHELKFPIDKIDELRPFHKAMIDILQRR